MKKKKLFPGAQIGKKSTAKLTGAKKKPNTATSKTTQASSSKLAGAAGGTRKSSSVASVNIGGGPAKMSPAKSTKKAVDVAKAKSFDKAKKNVNKGNTGGAGSRKREKRVSRGSSVRRSNSGGSRRGRKSR